MSLGWDVAGEHSNASSGIDARGAELRTGTHATCAERLQDDHRPMIEARAGGLMLASLSGACLGTTGLGFPGLGFPGLGSPGLGKSDSSKRAVT